MELNEMLVDLLNQLKEYGLDRRSIEKELVLSTKYLDQAVSEGGNKKLLASLRLLLKVKQLERGVNNNASPNKSLLDMVDNINKKVSHIDDTVSLSAQHILVNQSLSRSLLTHAAHMESLTHKVDFHDIMKQLNEMSELNYRQVRQLSSPGLDNEQSKIA